MSTNRYVVDSWAWIEYLDGTAAGAKAKKHIENDTIFTNAVSVAEVVSRAARKGKDADVALDKITAYSKVIIGDELFAKEVGLIHADIKKSRPNFSLADAFTLCTARNLHAKVLTGDPDFEGMKEAEFIRR